MVTTTTSITELEALKNQLTGMERILFDRYFRVDTTIGRLQAPESMRGWIEKSFGTLGAVASQRIVKVTNLLTLEGALFNEIRASRPMDFRAGESIREAIDRSTGDPFCTPEAGTPADGFGRVKGAHCITASNVAKYDGYHGLVIFEEHNPLEFTRDAIADYFETAREWARRAHCEDPGCHYFFMMWNCLWKSGASIVHGHAQMTLTKGMHYAKAEALRRVWESYKRQYNGTCYFSDLVRIHQSLNLTWEQNGVKGLAYLTPIKEKEIMLIAPEPGAMLYDAVYHVLEKYRAMGVTSFNLALYVPPLTKVMEDWDGFPAVVRMVDRGNPNNKTVDFGAMELYASSVITSDPFKVAEVMQGN